MDFWYTYSKMIYIYAVSGAQYWHHVAVDEEIIIKFSYEQNIFPYPQLIN